ncbi:hypothetical protein [Actinoplanes derwentensis]|uniref:Uncharacterized protein n=1 Tax=Actinoplanes derwentensis TaxID=113562 RepID=A0A1H2CX54_9ACTN|nr:hypothetical protein [Actinoplanes derwentensis]GID82795.1 hypothetical protein Ade03nite_17190 [Actinoplanes derwentensis]SDT75041.1 hypothetical protein SAMN04489716_7175 [Actinoplanes derwentensis]
MKQPGGFPPGCFLPYGSGYALVMRLFSTPAPRWAIVAVALWTIAPILVVFGGWPGLIGAVLVGGYGSHLLRKRQQWMTSRTTAAPTRTAASGRPAVFDPAAGSAVSASALR